MNQHAVTPRMASIWHRSGDLPAERAAFANRSLFACVAAACVHPAGGVALAGNDERISRPALMVRVRKVAAQVQRRVSPGQSIAALLPQTPAGVAALIGCAVAGRVCVVLNPADPAERIRFILDDAAPGAVLFDDAAVAQRQA